jgi:hypothetical protein
MTLVFAVSATTRGHTAGLANRQRQCRAAAKIEQQQITKETSHQSDAPEAEATPRNRATSVASLRKNVSQHKVQSCLGVRGPRTMVARDGIEPPTPAFSVFD